MSETSKFRYLTARYCQGVGVDLGSAGDPVVPTAIQVDLPDPYCPALGHSPIQIRGDARELPWFADGTLDYVYSSHLLEDFCMEYWLDILTEWTRVLRRGGYLVILVPERGLWKRALQRGQPPNEAHRHEPVLGELTEHASELPLQVLHEEIPDPTDYSILFVARKK